MPSSASTAHPTVDAGQQTVGRPFGGGPQQVAPVVGHLPPFPMLPDVLDLMKAPLPFRKAHAVPSCGRSMQRVVVGGGLAGLAAPSRRPPRDTRSSCWRRATASRRVPRTRTLRRPRTRPSRAAARWNHASSGRRFLGPPPTVALAPHRLHVIGHGPLRSLRSVRATASVRRASVLNAVG